MRGKALMLVLAIGLAGSVQGCNDASRDRASYCARIAWIARGSPEEFRVLRRSIGAEGDGSIRSEEHTSELQSLMRISYAVFCLKKKKQIQIHINNQPKKWEN